MTEVLVVGQGGREDAIARAISLSPHVDTILCAPGNAGTETIPHAQAIPLKPEDIGGIVDFAKSRNGDLTVVIGPEQPLVAGLSDALRQNGIRTFGPSRKAATELEGSKIKSNAFMAWNGIPHPKTSIIKSKADAVALLEKANPHDIVIKADGLANGKGVILPDYRHEAIEKACAMLEGKAYNGAGRDGILIQERLHGPEISAFVLSDGDNFSLLRVFSQDHKRKYDGDQGPNTGGMGAFSPVPPDILSDRQIAQIEQITGASIEGAKSDGNPYNGILYIGLILAEEYKGDPQVIEYNARLGDPEAQVVLPLLNAQGIDVYEMMRETADGNAPLLQLNSTAWAGHAALTVCLASRGYPGHPEKRRTIHGLDRQYDNVTINYGATRRTPDGQVLTHGGRVLYVTGEGETIDHAAEAAYAAIGKHAIWFDGAHCRTDIGYRAREKKMSTR